MAEDRRWAVVTGASSGIGAEIARVLAQRGYDLVLVARRQGRLEALQGELTTSHGGAVETLALDLESPAAPLALHETLVSRGIAVHTLVNNAGFGMRGSFATLPYDRQMAMIELNVSALTKLCRLMLPAMIERRRGGIVNIASTAAYQAGPNMAVYYATKAFVLSLSEALHEEAKRHGVTVTALCPGPTDTEFSKVADVEMVRKFKFGRMPAAEVARAGIAGYEAGRAVVVPGATNRIGAVAAQLLPRALVRRIAGKLQG
jgi:short-subunit dehydrogenase